MWLKEKEQNLLWEDKNLIQIGEHIKYSYNTKGIRTKKETEEGTTEYSLIGSKIMKMEKVTSSGKITMYFTYDQRDELQSVTESNKEYYYIKDITGNIIKIKDEEGNSIVEYKYDAYGKVEKTIIENNNVSKYKTAGRICISCCCPLFFCINFMCNIHKNIFTFNIFLS